MIEKMETESKGTTVVNRTVNITQTTPSPIGSETLVNRTLYAIIAVLFVAVVSTYFVEDLPGFVIDLRSMAIDALWLMLCCYTIGELAKRIYINKARATKEYGEAKQAAREALEGLTADELERRVEYCTAYEDELYATEVKRLLKNASISEADYVEKYAALSAKEVRKQYPTELSKKQLKKLDEINRVERVHYDPSFLNSTTPTRARQAPSEMYDVGREDRKNMISSAVASVFSGFFGVTLAGELIFSFSLAVLFSAIVKVTLTLIFTSLKANFGWNLVMKTEISRYEMQKTEAGNLKSWCVKNPKQNLQSTAKSD